MGRIFVVELEGRSYRCKYCKTHLALADDLISRAFHCRRGKAYLFNNVVNITAGVLEERMMLSGLHTVADIFCCCCGQIVGWKYETVHEKSQQYKEGKFVLERYHPILFLVCQKKEKKKIILRGTIPFFRFSSREEGLLMKLISPLNSILTLMPA
ncbi:protein yippee-like At5g53940 isoform X1 [Neltuma alba]|uniref:protein yippee-like At5g53940 isoform X1 n=1 Tax=Neltuma alba TaxID=207710 RepID=UPI0010A594B9|nr:protein yippee-like At5g53940 isoform X1 [Prosopis alba]